MINELKNRFEYNQDTGKFIDIESNKESGWITDNGYRIIGFKGTKYRAHRLAWLIIYGEFPENDIDHINGNRDDNRISNLRSVTRSENLKNQKIRSDNSSGVIGVSWGRSNSKWHVRIKSDVKYLYLGSFFDFFEACCVRKSAEVFYGFHVNHGRAV